MEDLADRVGLEDLRVGVVESVQLQNKGGRERERKREKKKKKHFNKVF